MSLGAAIGADVCSGAVGVGADNIVASDVEIDADLFTVWGTETTVGDFCPSRFAVWKFNFDRISIVVVFRDGMIEFTTEDAAGWVTRSAALRKRLAVITGSFPTASRGTEKTVLARGAIFWRCRKWILFFYEKSKFVSRFSSLIFHGIMIYVKSGGFSTVFATQL